MAVIKDKFLKKFTKLCNSSSPYTQPTLIKARLCLAQVGWLMAEVGLYFSHHSQRGPSSPPQWFTKTAGGGRGRYSTARRRQHHLYPCRPCSPYLCQRSGCWPSVITGQKECSRNWALTVKWWRMERRFNDHASAPPTHRSLISVDDSGLLPTSLEYNPALKLASTIYWVRHVQS